MVVVKYIKNHKSYINMERTEDRSSPTIGTAVNRLESLIERKNTKTDKRQKRDAYLVGLIKLNTNRPYTENPERIIEAIEKGKKKGLTLLVGPEWGLCASAEKPSSTFSVRDYMSVLSPREALDYWRGNIPYSPREALKVIDALCDATKGSDMVVMPGTMMVYTQSDRLYNVMPVVSNGKLIYSVLKYVNGGSSDFALGGLKFESGRERGAVFEHGGIKFGVEICADRGGLESKLDGCDEKDKPDIQVLSSCGADKTVWAAKEDGYLLCSDGCGQEVYAITHTKGRNRTETISPSFPTGVPYLFVYKLPKHTATA